MKNIKNLNYTTMTFFESLKKWFYTKNSSAASSDARVPLLDASGNPKGSDTMANLASVLGETIPFSGGDLNTLVDNRVWNFTSSKNSYTNLPSGVGDYPRGVLVVHAQSSNGYVKQIYHEMYTPQNVSWMRCRTQGTWSQWAQITTDIPAFYKDYATLQALCEAIFYVAQSAISDCDTAPFGFSMVNANTLHIPAQATMTLLTIGNNQSQKTQLCLRATGVIYYRGYAAGWSEWKQVQMISI